MNWISLLLGWKTKIEAYLNLNIVRMGNSRANLQLQKENENENGEEE